MDLRVYLFQVSQNKHCIYYEDDNTLTDFSHHVAPHWALTMFHIIAMVPLIHSGYYDSMVVSHVYIDNSKYNVRHHRDSNPGPRPRPRTNNDALDRSANDPANGSYTLSLKERIHLL